MTRSRHDGHPVQGKIRWKKKEVDMLTTGYLDLLQKLLNEGLAT